MSFLIGAIGGWPPPSEFHMGERQVNDATGGGAVGVPAQQVCSGSRGVEWQFRYMSIEKDTRLFF